MKSDKLQDAMSNIKDDFILESTQEKQKNKKGSWAFAAAAAVCLLAGGLAFTLFQPQKPAQKESNISEINKEYTGDGKAISLVADYPEAAKKVSSEDYYQFGKFNEAAFEKDIAEWDAANKEIREAAQGLVSALEDFNTSIVEGTFSNTEGENRACSPANLYLSFAMLAEITDGNTRQEILEVLGAENIEEVRDVASRLWRSNYIDNGEMLSTLANSLWLRSGITVSEEKLKLLMEEYFADVYSGNPTDAAFSKALADWLKMRTGGLLNEQIDKLEMDPQMVLSLASTIYFRAKWQDPFYSELNQTATFHGTKGDVSAEFMCSNMVSRYYYYDHFGAIQLSFSGGASMWLLLPDEGYSPEDLTKNDQLSFILREQGEDFYFNNDHVTSTEVHLKLPKFDLISEFDEASVLKKLGVKEVFNSNVSDFSPLFTEDNGIFLSKVQHDVRVAIDEEGCTATAFTLESLAATSAPQGIVEFTLDRPFLFVITSPTGAILFTGCVNNIAGD